MMTLPKSCPPASRIAAGVLGRPDVLRTVGLGAATPRLDRPLLPDAVLPCLGHQKEREQEGHGRQRNRIGKSPAQTSGGQVGGRRDDRHEAASPPIANVIW